MNISCTRCSPDLLGASLSDCQSVCLDISRNICLSVTRRQDCKCVRLPEWIVTGSFWEFLQAAGGGGTALVVTLVAGRLPLWTWTGWSGLCAGTLAEQLITTSPSPALRPPLEPPPSGATQQVTPHLMPELTPRLFRSTPVSATMSSKWEPKVGQGTAKHRFEKTPNESCFEVKM